MKRIVLLAMAAVPLVSCTGEPPPPPEPKTCGLTTETLADKTFIRQMPKQVGDGYDADPLARMHFYKEGDATKVKYTVRSQIGVYQYTCNKDEKEPTSLLCLQDNPDPLSFCRSLWANTGGCDEATLAQVMGMSVTPEISAAAKTVADETAKMKEKDLAQYKMAWNNTQNQLRGVLKVKPKDDDPKDCRIAVSDHYETFVDGKRKEMENVVGSSRFVETNQEYVFEDCANNRDLVAMATDAPKRPGPGESQVDWTTNSTVAFVYVGKDAIKSKDGCTYSMDTFWDYVPRGAKVPVEPTGSDLDWKFDVALSGKGIKVAHMYRYETCAGAEPKRIDVTCQLVRLQ